VSYRPSRSLALPISHQWPHEHEQRDSWLALFDLFGDGLPHALKMQHSPAPFVSIAGGQTDVSSPSHRSTETACAVTHTKPWQRGSIQEGRRGESDHRPGGGYHACSVEQASRWRTCGRALMTAICYTTLLRLVTFFAPP
jgi:hypothetical protein